MSDHGKNRRDFKIKSERISMILMDFGSPKKGFLGNLSANRVLWRPQATSPVVGLVAQVAAEHQDRNLHPGRDSHLRRLCKCEASRQDSHNDYIILYTIYILSIYTCIYGPVLRLSTPPHGLGPQVAAPIPFYLQAIGSISEVQLRIC